MDIRDILRTHQCLTDTCLNQEDLKKAQLSALLSDVDVLIEGCLLDIAEEKDIRLFDLSVEIGEGQNEYKFGKKQVNEKMDENGRGEPWHSKHGFGQKERVAFVGPNQIRQALSVKFAHSCSTLGASIMWTMKYRHQLRSSIPHISCLHR